MAKNFKNLSHAFKGADADEHRLSRVLMVGGLHDKQNVISDVDSALLRHALRVLEAWSIPVSPNLEAFRDYREKPDTGSVRIINILPEHGGEDFLKSQEKGDIVILCNIARDVDDKMLMKKGNMAYLDTPARLRDSFSSSPDHRNLSKWHEQFDKSDAKIVMITNADGFSLQEMNNGSFVQISLPFSGATDDWHMGMLVRRDYLSTLENYLMVVSVNDNIYSPLLNIAAAADMHPESRFSYNFTSGRTLEFPGPGQP